MGDKEEKETEKKMTRKREKSEGKTERNIEMEGKK